MQRGKLDFCPFDFEKIDMDNLAYELVLQDGWTWENVKKKTVVGEAPRRFIIENDIRAKERFNDKSTSERVFLSETGKPGGKNGFKLFCEMIDINNAKEDRLRQEAVSDSGAIVDSLDEDEFDDSDFVGSYDNAGYGDGSKRPTKLEHKKNDDGIDVFADENSLVIITALPCCPKCHARLPIGWDIAEEFCAVSLTAPTSGGKTTFLYSMLFNEWEAFQNLGIYNGKSISITSAHNTHDTSGNYYPQLCAAAEQMCKKGGKCPENTPTSGWIWPVFLKVQYGSSVYIFGIYDNSGENLARPNPDAKQNIRFQINKMNADIYLFDPAYMNIVLPEQKEKAVKKHIDQCKMLELQKQGEYQDSNAGKTISAKELLNSMDARAEKENPSIDIFKVYNSSKNSRQRANCLERMKTDMLFLGVIIKSDLLERAEAVLQHREYEVLFNRDYLSDLLDLDQISSRSALVEEMIDTLQLFGHRNIPDFRLDYGDIDEAGERTGRESVSWHCVSALGCSTTGVAGYLLGDYDPIRVAEPLLTCILKFLAKWTE